MKSQEKFKLRDQLLYIIANEELNYEEYYLPYSYYRGSHIAAYTEFLSENPELNLGFTIDRSLPEQMNERGMFVYHSFGSIDEKWRDYFYNFDYSAGIFIPKNFVDIQKAKLNCKLKELKKMYLELVYYENDKKVHLCNCKQEGSKYKVYQKLKNIVRG